MDEEPKTVILEVEGSAVECDKALLVKNSDYFAAMFGGDFRESSLRSIKIEGVALKAFNIILTLLADRDYVIDDEEIHLVLQASCMLQFQAIKQICESRILEILKPSISLRIWKTTELLNLTSLHVKAKYLALEEFSNICDSNQLLEFSIDDLCLYLGHVYLNVKNELLVFQTAMNWWYENQEHCDTEDCTKVILKLLNCIDFNILKENEIQEMQTYPDIIDNTEITSILNCVIDLKAKGINVGNNFSREHLIYAIHLCNAKSRQRPEIPSILLQCDWTWNPCAKKRNLYSDVGDRIIVIYDKFLHKKILLNVPQCSPFEKLFYSSDRWSLLYDELENEFKSVFLIGGDKVKCLTGFKLVSYKEFVFLYGGEFVLGGGNWNCNLWTYNTLKEKWVRKNMLPHGRRHFNTIILDNCIYVIGGIGKYRVIQENMLWYDFKADKWSSVIALPKENALQLKCCSFCGQLFLFYIGSRRGYFFNKEQLSWRAVNIKIESVFVDEMTDFTVFCFMNYFYIKVSDELFISKNELFNIIRGSECTKLDDQIQHLKRYLEERTKCPEQFLPDLHKKISRFISEFKKRWDMANRKTARFASKNNTWLESAICFRDYTKKKICQRGRPAKSFLESRERTKRQKTNDLRTKCSVGELAYATQMSLRACGQLDASKLVKEITSSSPQRAGKYRTAFKGYHKDEIKPLDAEEALSMIVDARLSRRQYNIIRSKDKLRFPSYKTIQKAKMNCYPNREYISISSTCAEVKLQALLDHTIYRLLCVQKEVLQSQNSDVLNNLVLTSKWGFDGSSGQSEYKQLFESAEQSDASIFLSSFVPLQLTFKEPHTEANIILWQNPRPSSTRFCRPIKFEFVHESTELVLAEKTNIESQIADLKPFSFVNEANVIQVTHKLLFTMVDGKICNSVTGTKSTQRCYICGLTSKHFNDLEKVFSTNIDTSNLQFGLSILHGWIRFFESLLHLSYKLSLEKWQARGTVDKEIVAERKKKIQSEFKKRLGLLVDKPKPGFGSTNDGNTARRFFEHSEVSADITGVDLEIIQRFSVVMQTIASGFRINVEKFRNYTRRTAEILVEKYPWYRMPTSVHKILCHGPEVVKNALLPIGQLSEEAQEARNKDFKKYREAFSRKISRQKTNEDIFNLLLVSSDPLISSYIKPSERKLKKFSIEVLDMLESPDVFSGNVIKFNNSLGSTEDEESSDEHSSFSE